MVHIGELNTAVNTFNVSDTIRWAGNISTHWREDDDTLCVVILDLIYFI